MQDSHFESARISITDKRKVWSKQRLPWWIAFAICPVRLNENKDVIFENPIYTDGEMDDITVEVAAVYNRLSRNCREFANNIHTHEGGDA